MDGRFIDASSSAIVKDAQKMILEFLEDYFDEEKKELVENALKNCPIYFEKQEYFIEETGRADDGIRKGKRLSGYAVSNSTYIVIREEHANKRFNPIYTEDPGTDMALHTIIHEYAHILCGTNSNYGHMFEEGFADTFARACIVNYKMKHQPIWIKNKIAPMFYNASSRDYSKAEAQVAAILYVLNQKDLDIKLIGEYIFGDRDVFKQKCIEIFGEEFESYFELANSRSDEYYNDYEDEDEEHNSEVKLVSLLANYIKNNDLNLRNYRDPDYWVLFRKDTRTLDRAIVVAGIEALKEDEKDVFNTSTLLCDWENKVKQDESEERKNKIKNTISERYDLAGKSKEEIYKIVQDICGEYIQRSSSRIKENRIFIEEMKKLIPNIEDFVNRTIELNHFTYSAETVLKNLDMENASYESINGCISSTLEQFKQEKLAQSIKTKFNGCDNKDDLLTRIEELKEHEGKIDLEQLLPNYGDFIKFVNELQDQIPDTFNQETGWNYESLYGEFLKNYISKKEKDLANSKELEKEYRKALKKIHIQYKVVENEEKFNVIKNNHDKLSSDLLERQQALEGEENDKSDNQARNDELVKRKEELQKKNIIIRFFKRREIRGLSNQIAELENAMHSNDANIEQIKGAINILQGEIKDNEQQLIDLCGLKISDYDLILTQCKSNDLTQDKLLENGSQIQEKIKGLEIPSQEQELANIYGKNGIDRKSENVQAQTKKQKNDEEISLE